MKRRAAGELGDGSADPMKTLQKDVSNAQTTRLDIFRCSP